MMLEQLRTVRRTALVAAADGMTAMKFLKLVLHMVAIHLANHPHSNAALFGSEWRTGHAMLAAPDLPFEALSLAECNGSIHELCSATGIINIGTIGSHLVLKYKWLVSNYETVSFSAFAN